MRNILFICLDSVRFDTFQTAEAENMKAIGPLKKVHAVACCTLPAIMAYLSGIPPIGSGRLDLFRRGSKYRYEWAPKFFTELGWTTAWLSSNPILLQLDSGLSGGFKRYFKYFKAMEYLNPHYRTGSRPGLFTATPEIAMDVKKIMEAEKGLSVFMCMLVMDTHRPYNFAGGHYDIDPTDPEKNFRNQVRAIEFFDAFFPEIVNQFRGRGETDIIVTSDHGELFGPVYWSHDPTTPHLRFDSKLFEIPFIVGELI